MLLPASALPLDTRSLKGDTTRVLPGNSTQNAPDCDASDSAAAQTKTDTISEAGRMTGRPHLGQPGDMTSAIILPDITFHAATAKGPETIKVSAAAQRVLDEVANHKNDNCFVCQESQKLDSCTDHVVQKIQIPEPVPVSDRMPDPSLYNEEPTLRPSQPPSMALASVLKALEDELSHLKMQLTLFQTRYAKHDASLGKRQRKMVYQKMEVLMREIEKKSDQIYSLYDVVEGQKNVGKEMTNKQVEVTLQSLGLATGSEEKRVPTKRPDGRMNQRARSHANDDDDSNQSDEEELPWEGFDTTVESTGRGF